MKFKHTEVFNFENALRGMRNPKNSWDRNDSVNCTNCTAENADSCPYVKPFYSCFGSKNFIIGKNDMKLAQTLISAGSEHRKFMRQIFVSVDITAPLYWWKEADTYKVGATANSTSTMHKLTSQPITMECFETDDFNPSLESDGLYDGLEYTLGETLVPELFEWLEGLRQRYLATKDKRYWKELIRWLPESWLQTRTVTMSYENIFNIVHQRKNHKLNEWSGIDNPELPNFIAWARTLPYAQELIFLDEENGQ